MSLLKDHLPVELVLAIHFKSFNSFLSSHFAFPFSDICVCVSSKHLSLPNFYNILLVYFAHYICISPMGKLQEIRFFFFVIQKKSHYQRYILPRKLICITGQPLFSNHLLSLSCEWSSSHLHPQIPTLFLSLGWYISLNCLTAFESHIPMGLLYI